MYRHSGGNGVTVCIQATPDVSVQPIGCCMVSRQAFVLMAGSWELLELNGLQKRPGIDYSSSVKGI